MKKIFILAIIATAAFTASAQSSKDQSQKSA